MIYPKRLIARIKGAMAAGMGPKLIAARTGIPCQTLKDWATGDRHAAIEPDRGIIDELRVLLLKEN